MKVTCPRCARIYVLSRDLPQVRAKCARCGARFESFADGTARELPPQPIAISAAPPPAGVLELGPDPAIGPQATRFARIDPAHHVPAGVRPDPSQGEGAFTAPQEHTMTLDTSHEARPTTGLRRAPSQPPPSPPSAVSPDLLRALEPALAPLAELVPAGNPALEVGLVMAWSLRPRPSHWS